MAEYGIDVSGLYRDEHPYWRYLVWIDGLPRNSRLWSAVADDPDAFDDAQLDDDEEPKARNPKMRDFSPEAEHLTNIEDLLKELITAFVAANSKRKPPKPKPSLRPVFVGIEAGKRKRMLAQHDFLKKALLPHKYGR